MIIDEVLPKNIRFFSMTRQHKVIKLIRIATGNLFTDYKSKFFMKVSQYMSLIFFNVFLIVFMIDHVTNLVKFAILDVDIVSELLKLFIYCIVEVQYVL